MTPLQKAKNLKMVMHDLDSEYLEDKRKYGKAISIVRYEISNHNDDSGVQQQILSLLERCCDEKMPFSLMIFDLNKLINSLKS